LNLFGDSSGLLIGNKCIIPIYPDSGALAADEKFSLSMAVQWDLNPCFNHAYVFAMFFEVLNDFER